jgi:hypothetical protein
MILRVSLTKSLKTNSPLPGPGNAAALKQRIRASGPQARAAFWLALLLACAGRAQALNVTVNSAADTHAANLGTGTDAAGHVSLRSALEAADNAGKTITITLPDPNSVANNPSTNHEYDLTLGEIQIGNNAESITIVGSGGPGSVRVRMTPANPDRILFINPPGTVSNVFTIISNVTFWGGTTTSDPYGGGAISGGGPGNALTIHNCVFESNSAPPGNGAGGAVNFAGGGSLWIDSSTFSNNQDQDGASLGGGAVFYFLQSSANLTGSLAISGCTFTNNSAAATNAALAGGGAIGIEAQSGAGGQTFSASIHNNNFLGNRAPSANGGAVMVNNGFAAANTVLVNFNRFFGNTADGSSNAALASINAKGSVNATNNWWGCNSGPGGCGDSAGMIGSGSGGTLTLAPWIELTNSVSAGTVLVNQSATLTAGFLEDSNGSNLFPTNLSALAGVPITFGSTALGSISGSPGAIQTDGTASATFTAGGTNGTAQVSVVLDNATLTSEITIGQPPSFTSAAKATFLEGSSNGFTVSASGFPAPTYIWNNALAPSSGVTFDTNTGVLSATPGAGAATNYVLSFTASNGVPPNATQIFTLTIGTPPSFGSATNASFPASNPGAFTVTAAGDPQPALSLSSGALPGGVSFHADTGLLSGTPAAGAGGIYPLVFTASNNLSAASQSFTLTVTQPPAITSAGSTFFTVGGAGAFTVSASGFPAPTLSASGALPGGVTFNAGLLSGTPAAGANGSYPLVFTASNGVAPNATQNFTLTVGTPPFFTSATNTSFPAGGFGTFTVTALGDPQPALSLVSGLLPGGVSFHPDSGILGGTPIAGSATNYPLVFTASNGVGAVTESFTLAVTQPAVITSTNNIQFTVGGAGTFTVTASGFPPPILSESGALPGGVTFNASTGVLAGTPAAGTDTNYALVFTAANTSGTNTQNFTLTVTQPPAFTSDNKATFIVGNPGSFTVTASGFPAPALSESGALPANVAFNAGNGLLAGTPAAGASGTYALVFTAANGVAPNRTQNFTLTVLASNTITASLNGNEFHLIFTGAPGQSYYVQTAGAVTGPFTDAPPALTADSSGLVQYTTNALSSGQQYFRVRSGP